MNITRRRFAELCAKAGLLTAGVGVSGCIEDGEEVDIKDIINNSASYYNIKTTRGFPEYVGSIRKTHCSKGCYVDSFVAYKLHSEPKPEAEYFLMGEDYSDNPYSGKPPKKVRDFNKEIKVKGVVEKDDNGEYFLRAYSVYEVKEV